VVTLFVSNIVDRCYSNLDGEKIYKQIKSYFDQGVKVVLSFKGIDSVTSSFVNSALIELLREFSFEYIKTNLIFKDTISQINDMIKRRFSFEVTERKKLLSV